MGQGASWYVIRTKPHKESQVRDALTSRGLETFYPTIPVQPVNPRAAKVRPFFPQYLFVRADLDRVGKSILQWVEGGHQLVQFDGQPASVPEYIILQLKQRINAIEAAGAPEQDGLKKGERVRITVGPLAGYEGIFDLRLSGSERVQVLLTMLGREVKAHVNAGVLERTRTT